MPTRRTSRASTNSHQGLTASTFKGLREKNLKTKGKGGSNVRLRDGDMVPIQFLQPISEFTEYRIHNFQEDGAWQYVPCTGDGCPLCDDESEARSKTTYRFLTVVYNLAEKKVQILEGPQNMAIGIFSRYKRNPTRFLKRTYDLSRLPTTPTSYSVDVGEDPVVRTNTLKLLDPDEYLTAQLVRYYGDDVPTSSALEDDEDEDIDTEDEDEDDIDDVDDEEDEEAEEDEDEEEEEEDEDDDDEEDEEPAPPRRRTPAKAAAATRRAPAKKAPARRAAAARR